MVSPVHIQYQEKRFTKVNQALIAQANGIIAEYDALGIQLTLRQLYYQFVARDILPNTTKSYDSLGELISNARLAGLVSWLSIEDRTRNVRENSHWGSPQSIIQSAARSYRRDTWEGQEHYVEVWVEKDALIGVVEPVAVDMDVPYFACRGYVSQSEQWRAGMRFADALRRGQRPVVIHLGDHDPSGIDMTRDNLDRLSMFAQDDVTVDRIALNMNQIEEYSPPPNPAKMSDSRAEGYVKLYGYESWELDALEPRVTQQLIYDAISGYLDEGRRAKMIATQERERQQLLDVAAKWEDR